MSATSPITRTLRSVQLTLLYLVLPDCIDCSQVAFVSVTPEECVYSRSPCSIPSNALKSRATIAAKRRSSSARISFSSIATLLCYLPHPLAYADIKRGGCSGPGRCHDTSPNGTLRNTGRDCPNH